MSKHTFPKGHKFGGNKPKLPYKTKAVGVRVPEDIHAECVAVVKERVLQWKILQGYNKNNSFESLKNLLGIDK
ncbi:hypothetical protein UFOVP129_75 [uncultured Caudovirales phage]|uniref:Uncharacterized protein n=1 Tax=uncultured Caudovirales phage TaxID=2100421 RepID=A0A6J5LBA7_9CAUD|nr:hypothetical protein UFOVP129_75 [uncultured Caudovirales phage]